MGRPRWEVAGNEIVRQIYHREMGLPRWEVAGKEVKTNLPEEMGRPRREVAGNEMGRRIYHKRWGVQDGKWQVYVRWEEKNATGDGTFKMGSGR